MRQLRSNYHAAFGVTRRLSSHASTSSGRYVVTRSENRMNGARPGPPSFGNFEVT
jgi:hypothetical protein